MKYTILEFLLGAVVVILAVTLALHVDRDRSEPRPKLLPQEPKQVTLVLKNRGPFGNITCLLYDKEGKPVLGTDPFKEGRQTAYCWNAE